MKFGKKEKETQEEEVVRGEIQRVVPDYRVGLNPEQIRISVSSYIGSSSVRPASFSSAVGMGFVVNITYSQCRKTDNRIHWCPDIMRHIGKESTLCLVCCLRCTYCLRKCLIHFPVRGTV